jgi:3-deoxy-D-manno-octulosonate 8-phosphate phosphatase (KDO 8-P phosphatase)
MTAAEKASRIRLLLFDVDGVLTDGAVVLHGDGTESKAFHIRDGAGIVFAHRAGLTVGLLSSRSSGATAQRAAQLAIRLVVQGAASKLAAYERIVRDAGLTDEAVSYMGDDFIDIPVLERAGLAAAPCDAIAEVRERADWISAAPGGRGAARELIEFVLRAQARWDEVTAQYLQAAE